MRLTVVQLSVDSNRFFVPAMDMLVSAAMAVAGPDAGEPISTYFFDSQRYYFKLSDLAVLVEAIRNLQKTYHYSQTIVIDFDTSHLYTGHFKVL